MNQQEVGLVLCGSINPITNMHLRMFELARDYLRKNTKFRAKFGGISPTADSYGKPDLVEAKHRQMMCKLALESNPWVSMLRWESDQPSWTPTVQVLQHYGRTEEIFKDLKLMLLCGADLLESFTTPGLWLEKDIKNIINDFGIVVITRPDYDPHALINNSAVLQDSSSNIHLVEDWNQSGLSSTKLRRAIREGNSIRYLTPDPVIEYIDQHGLYKTTTNNLYQELAPFRLY
uniref:Nicotinamide-nucleotide adenylyltransferase n=1 Tax=Ciona savignyi TaxID=51511 RepID=H2YH94_CIOSA